jgi:predicted permease
MTNLLRELRFGVRTLVRKPGFSTVAILTLTLAIAACTIIYSIVHGVLLQPLPYPEADRLVQVWQVNRGGGQIQFSDPNFEDLRDQTRAFDAVAQYASGASTVIVGAAALRAQTCSVSAGFFDVFQTGPLRGRVFAEPDRHPGAAPVAIVSHGFWQRAMGAADVTSASIRIGSRTYAVIGVMPARFDFPEGVEIWMPREQSERNPYRTGHNWRVVGRVAGGASLAAARADVTAVARRLERTLGDDTHMIDVALVPLHEQIAGPVRRSLVLLLAAVGCLIVIACANLANLLGVHVSGRRRELAVRSALGAGGTSLALPLLAETVLLAAVGGTFGIVLGAAGLRLVIALEPGNLPRLAEVGVRWPVVAVALGVTASTAIVLGLAASWSAARSDVLGALKQSQRGQTGSAASSRLRSALVVAQLAVSLVLLVGTGLLGRSLALLLARDPGFRTAQVLTIDLSTPAGTPELDARRVQFHERLLERLAALPGVQAAGGVHRFPLGTGYSSGTFVKAIPGESLQNLNELMKLTKDPSRTGGAEFRVTSGSYFRAMGIPVLSGRVFEEGDVAAAPHVAVISESLAKASWPGVDPIGRRVQFGGMDGDLREFTIVGVVGDIRERGVDSPTRPTFYADYRQRPRMTGNFTVVLHAHGDPVALIAPVRAVLRELDPDVAPGFRTIEQVFASSVADRRFSLVVLGGFAAVALLLAVVGIYGVLAYVVAQRTREFGVRMALGARRQDVWRLVLRQAAALVLAGISIGLVTSWFVTGLMRNMLFGITPTDPMTLAGVVVVLATTALVACQIPALRATRADPLNALRAE